MSAQRDGSVVEPSHRSVVPSIPGVPWWAAVLIAVGATALGYLIDSGHKELTTTFAGLYIVGCVAAVLAVRQAALFTAVIQPPLILFCAVPGAYWLFHGGKVDKFKDLLINCGYPLIERFPLMLGTAGGVLLIGLIRWYFGRNDKAAMTDAAGDDVRRPSMFSGIVAKLSSLVTGISGDDPDAADDAPRSHAKTRTARTSRSERNGGRTAQRTTRPSSRHARPDDAAEASGERPRRRRTSDSTAFDPADRPRRPRRRPEGDPDLGTPPPRDARREPRPRRSYSERPYERSYERPEPRSRFDPYEPYDRPESSARGERRNRHERRGGYEPYPPYEQYEPRNRRTASGGSNGSGPTHHPISQVRYRGQARSEPQDEPHSERRTRSRAPRRPSPDSWDPDSWDYDA